MKTIFFIALRYFVAKKKTQFVQVIVWLSILGVSVGTMALVVVLSVFNGLEETIFDIYSYLDPDIKIEAVKGKTFEKSAKLLHVIHKTGAISEITDVIEDNVLVKYGDQQSVVRIKGVSDNYIYQYPIENALVNGTSVLLQNNMPLGLVGRGVQYRLGIDLKNTFWQLQFWYPKRNSNIISNPEKAFSVGYMYPGGVFAVEKQYDEKYIFVPLAFAQQLMDYSNQRTSLELKLKDQRSIQQVKNTLKEALGSNFLVLTKDEQHAGMLRAIQIERFFLFITFSIILLVSSLNIFFSLTMLVLDKKRDIQILYSMGANSDFIYKIFLIEGVIIASIGTVIGLSLGFAICYVQQKFGFVSMGTETSIINTYPVKMQWVDFVYTAFIMSIITILISLKPAQEAKSLATGVRSI